MPTPNDSPTPPPAETPAWVALRWPMVFIALALLAFGAYWLTLKGARDTARGVTDLAGSAADRAQAIAEGFFSGDVTDRFLSSMPEVANAGQGRLEVATAEITERLSRSEERRLAWDTLSLGTTTVEIEVPVTYRYHLRLEDEWKLEIHGPVCLVTAPKIRPSLPPAIHTEGMRSRTEQGLLRFDGAEQMETLQRNLTPRLSERARSPKHLNMVREPARETVEQYVRTWLLQQDYWSDDRFATVKVQFADEVEASAGDTPQEGRIEVDAGGL